MKMARCLRCDRRRPLKKMVGVLDRQCVNVLLCSRARRRLDAAFARRVLSRPEWPQHPRAWAAWKTERHGWTR
jgi:hypothetical protein